MLGFDRWYLLKGLVAIVCAAGIVSLALAYFIPAPPSNIEIAASFKGSSYEHFGLRYKEALAGSRITLNLRETDGPIDNVRLVKDPRSGVDLAFSFGGVTNSKESPELMSMGRISYAPVWIFYHGTETLESLTQLKGKRIAIPAATRRVVDPILQAHGVNSDNSVFSTRTSPDGARALKDGEVDVFIMIIELGAPLVQTLLRDPGLRLMSVAQAEGIARVYPFLSRLVLPQGVIDFEKNIPARDVILIADTQAVFVRKDLHPEIIYLLAQAMSELHSAAGVLQKAGEFPKLIDPELPMSEIAVDFYKNGPTFLNKYLPQWMVIHIQRLLAATLAFVAIFLPVFSYAPKLYGWVLHRYMGKLQTRLRLVETHLQGPLTALQIEEQHTELRNIDRAADLLPMRHSDLFLAIKNNVVSASGRLAARPAELQNAEATADTAKA